jgi:hypothetical protein
MSTSTVDMKSPLAQDVHITGDTLSVDLSDGRSISVPLAWFPRLVHGSAQERSRWRFIGQGHGIHWDELDEDISVAGLLAGKPSRESRASLSKWLQKRKPKKR